MQAIRAVLWMAGKILVQLVLAIWFIAACAGAYVALWFFWPMLSSALIAVWTACRVPGAGRSHIAIVSIEVRRGRERPLRVVGADRLMRRQILARTHPSFSVELARSRWVEAASALVWAPLVLQGPLYVAASLILLAAMEEPKVVVEWSWLPVGAMLLAGQVVSLVAFVWYAGRQFVGRATIGRRFAIPLSGRALCVAYRDVCAVDIQRGQSVLEGISVHVIRFMRTGGDPVDLTFSDKTARGSSPSAELLALTALLARTARVPLRSSVGMAALGTQVSTT